MASNEALLEEIDRSRKRERSVKQRVAAKSEEILGYGCVIAGGAVGGYIDAKWPDRKWFSVGAPVAVGLGCVVVGVGDFGGKASHAIGSLGAGLLGAEAYKVVYDRTAKGKKTTAGDVGAEVRQISGARMSAAEMRQVLLDLAAQARAA